MPPFFSASTTVNLQFFPKTQYLCIWAQYHQAQTDMLATITQPRHWGHISGSQGQELSRKHKHPLASSRYWINICREVFSVCYSPKVLFQGLSMQSVCIHDSKVNLITPCILQNYPLTSLMNCPGSLFPKASPS